MQHSDTIYLSAKNILDTHISPNQRIALGISGGCDSMTLLSIVQKYYLENKFDPKNIHVLFCDHQTREATKQERKLVQQYSLKNTIVKFTYTQESYDENSLRQRRHKSFISYCKEHNITIVGLGHHLDDRIEGTLLNFSRGARKSGILSITSHTPHFLDSTIDIVRPLIHNTKTSILEYCDNHTLRYSEDISNADVTISQRNQIRTLTEPLSNPRRYQGFKYLYETLEKQQSPAGANIAIHKTLSIMPQDTYDIVNIISGNRTPEILYHLYEYYAISINPRATTLSTLSQQLNQQSGNKILYQGLEIKAYTYASIVTKK